MQKPSHPPHDPRNRPGVFWLDGTEVLGYAHYDTYSDGVERIGHFITTSRPPAHIRAQWPEERRAKEDAAWRELVEVDARYWHLTENWRDKVRSRDDSTGVLGLGYSNERKNAKRRYERVAYQEQERAQRHAQREGRAAQAAWEAAGRICAVCGVAVGVSEPYVMSPDPRKDPDGGEVPATYAFRHARCDRAFIASQLDWLLTEDDSDAGRHCAVCHKDASGSVSVMYGEKLLIAVPLCEDHLDMDVAMRIIDEDVLLDRIAPGAR